MQTLLDLSGLTTLARVWAWLMEPMIHPDHTAVPARIVIPALPVRRWSPPAPRHAAGPATRHHALALSH